MTVLDKSRGVGGRIATRRAPPFQFDHGAQFFKIRTRQFQSFMQPLIDSGVVTPWCGKFAEITEDRISHSVQWGDQNPHYVGVPSNNAIGKYLAKGVDLQQSQCVQSIQLGDGHYLITDKQVYGPYDWIFVTTPIPQAIALVTDKLYLLR